MSRVISLLNNTQLDEYRRIKNAKFDSKINKIKCKRNEFNDKIDKLVEKNNS